MKKKLVVIGGGFGGIAAALRAKSAGLDVTIIDKCSSLGGRAQAFHRPSGYKHDAGPTVITAPWLLEELFHLFNKPMSEYIQLKELDVWYQFVYDDGTKFNYQKSLKKTLNEINKINPPDVIGYKKLLEQSKKIFDIGFTKLSDVPFHRLSFMLSQVPDMIKLKAYKTVWQFTCSHLENDKLRRAFSIQPLLVGGNPFNTTCIYSLIHFLERKWGVFFALGGTGAIVKGLQKLMTENDIKVITNKKIVKINTLNKKVIGVETENEKISLDFLVSNIDPPRLYSLIDRKKLNIKLKLKKKFFSYSMALFVLFFGTKFKYNNIKHHTILFGKSYEKLLNEIFEGKDLPNDFSLYLHRPTATDPSFAPKNCDSFYVLAPVPNLKKSNVDWKIYGEIFKNKIISHLESTLLPNLKNKIEDPFYMTPLDFKNNYESEYGAGFSIAPLFYQSAWFRYHNKSEYFKNLYLVGAGTHPGAGLPGVISSAKIFEKLLKEDIRNEKIK